MKLQYRQRHVVPPAPGNIALVFRSLRHLKLALFAALLVAGCATAPTTPPVEPAVRAAILGPRGAINEDVTQANIDQTICVPGWTATVRP